MPKATDLALLHQKICAILVNDEVLWVFATVLHTYASVKMVPVGSPELNFTVKVSPTARVRAEP